MCGRFALGDLTWRQLRDWLALGKIPESYDGESAGDADELQPRYNVAPTTMLPIVRLVVGERQGDLARWGLVPHWFSKPIREMRLSTINARSEEVASKPTFRSVLKNRCLIPAIGYYEWTGPKGAKQPHFITVERNAPGFCFAGLWSCARLPDFEGLTCTILTSTPETQIVHIHDRMPIIVDESGYDGWLSGECGVSEIRRVSGERLRSHPVGREVGAVRHDGPS